MRLKICGHVLRLTGLAALVNVIIASLCFIPPLIISPTKTKICAAWGFNTLNILKIYMDSGNSSRNRWESLICNLKISNSIVS
jgi:hypothetical protein